MIEITGKEFIELRKSIYENKMTKLLLWHTYFSNAQSVKKRKIQHERRFSVLMDDLKKNTSVKILDVSDCDMKNEELRALANALKVRTDIQGLSMDHCDNASDFSSFIEALSSLKDLSYLNISHGGLSDETGAALFEALKNNKKLAYLNAGKNDGFSKKSAQACKELLESHPSLNIVHFENVEWMDEDVALIAEGLAKSPAVYEFHLSSENFLQPALIVKAVEENPRLIKVTTNGLMKTAEEASEKNAKKMNNLIGKFLNKESPSEEEMIQMAKVWPVMEKIMKNEYSLTKEQQQQIDSFNKFVTCQILLSAMKTRE
jgi:Ran GTPase-activating protein (RanGAP) involved in mRNA processing and transport